MKIAIYSGVIPSTTFIELLIQSLGRQGHEVLVFGKKGAKAHYPGSSIRCFYRPTDRLGILLSACHYWLLFLICKPRYLKRIYSLVRNENRTIKYFLARSAEILPVLWAKPEVFHIQWARLLPRWIFLRSFSIKIVVSLRGAQINYSPITVPGLADIYRKYFPLVDGFHAVSEAICKEASIYGASVTSTRVVYSYISDGTIKLGARRLADHNSRTSKNRMSIISVGRCHWKKGYRFALDAMKILDDKDVDFLYTIVAQGNDEEYVHQIADLELGERVSILPGLSHEKVLRKITEFDIMLLSSVEEGIANVVLEAMALGTLVISTTCGGMNEIITHGENGFLVPIRDSQAIADMILHVSGLSVGERMRIVRNAHDAIREGHDYSHFSRELNSLYRWVLRGA